MRVMDEGTVEILSASFHHYLIPCRPSAPARFFDHMQQQVTIAPLRDHEGIQGCLITLADVTTRIEREQELARDLKSPNELTRIKAAQALADGAAGSPLISALKDDSWRVRQVAVGGLARNGGKDAVEALLRALHDEHRHPGVLNSALQVLAMMDVDIATPLIEFLKSPDVDLRIYAAHALGEQNNPATVQALRQALKDADGNVQFHAIEALGKLRAAEAAPSLIEIAKSQNFFLVFPAIEALTQIGNPSYAPQLMPLLNNELFQEPVVR